MEHAATLDLHQFEDPKFYDHLERARQGTTRPRRAAHATARHGAERAHARVAERRRSRRRRRGCFVLLVVAVLPSFIGETHFAGLSYSLLFRWTPQRRQLDYVRYVGASDRTAKEVQLFGLAPWLISRYRALSDRFYAENRALAIKKAFVSSGLSLIGTLGYYGAYVVGARADDRRRDLARHADLSRRVVSPEPRPDSRTADVGERHLRAEPVSSRTCSRSSTCSRRSTVVAERAPGAAADPRRASSSRTSGSAIRAASAGRCGT